MVIVSSAATNIGVHVSLQIRIFSRYMPRNGIARSCGNSIFSFFKDLPYSFPQWLFRFTFPSGVEKRSLFSAPSPAFMVCGLFNDGYSDWSEVIPYCHFDLHLLCINDIEHLFMCFFGHLYVFFGEMSI